MDDISSDEIKSLMLNIVLIDVFHKICSVDKETWLAHIKTLKEDCDPEGTVVYEALEQLIIKCHESTLDLDKITTECPKEEL